MKYMLDTDTCIYLIKNKPACVRAQYQAHREEELFISSITYAELCHGAQKSAAPEKNRLSLLLFLSYLEILNFDPFAAEEYGVIRAGLERKGTLIGPKDMLIAAHAKAEKCILVTNNTREFSRVEGLMLENWAN